MELLTNYIIALTHFYGVVTPEIVTAIYNQQNEQQVVEADVREYLYNPPKELAENYVFQEGNLFVQDSLFIGDDTLVQLIEAKSGKPYYIPEKSELKKYVDPNYIEKDEHYHNLYNYLDEHFKNFTDEFLEEICENFVLVLRENELNFGYIVRHLKNSGISLENSVNFDAVVSLVTELGAHVRMWSSNGYTRKEVLRTEIATLLHEEAYNLNVVTDIPCRCGSGKRYKDCCITKEEKIKRLDDYRQ